MLSPTGSFSGWDMIYLMYRIGLWHMVDVQSKVAFNTLPGWPQATWPQGTAWTEKKPLSLRVREEPKTLSVCSAGKGMIFSPETRVIFKHWATFVAWVPACRKGCQCILAPRKPDCTFELLGCEIYMWSQERGQGAGLAGGPGELRATGQLVQGRYYWANQLNVSAGQR